MVFDSVAFKNVISNGLVLDKTGLKMSKRLGNAVDPFETIDAYGADATRWYMISNAPPWDNLKFDVEGIDEVRRKFFGTLYNTYSFFSLYANIDGFAYSEASIPLQDRTEIDRWVISLLNSLIKEVEQDYADYEPTLATRKIQVFVDEHLSNWYVRLCRRRFWKGEYAHDKIAAYQTLYECLEALSKLMAPVAPFFGDWLFQNLNNVSKRESVISVHLADFATSNAASIDKALEERMDYAQRISSLVLSLRKKDNIRVRQPLNKILIPTLSDDFTQQVLLVEDLIKAEVNVKTIELLDDTSGVIKKKAKPNFKTLGKKLGKHMKTASQMITDLSQADIAIIEKSNRYTLTIDGEDFELTNEDFEIVSEDIPGWQVANDRDITVALDTTITDDLFNEGLAREIVNRIQNIRKNSDFEVMDKINVVIEENDAIVAALKDHKDYIAGEVLASSIEIASTVSEGEEVDLSDTIKLNIAVSKA
jgi:isoleucyl-tRNA synthetase